MPISRGDGSPRTLLEHLGGSEIGEAHAECAHHASATPTAAQFNLVRRLLFHRVLNVHRAVLGVLDGVDPKRFGVEITQLRKLALRSDDVGSAEQITGSRSNFTVHHVVVGLGVALYHHAANPELLPLHHPDLDVDGVSGHPLFNGTGLERQIAVVLVQGTQVQPFGVHEDPSLQTLHAEHFSALDVQQAVELRRAVFGVSRERDFPKVKGVAFLDPHVQHHLAFPISAQAVAKNACVAVALAVVVVDHQVEVATKRLFEVFRRLVKAPPPTLLGVLHLSGQLIGVHGFDAVKGNLVNFDLVALVNVDAQAGAVGKQRVRFLLHGHRHIQEPLVHVVVSNPLGRNSLDVVVEDSACQQIDFSLDRFLLRAADP